ncbi:phosphatase 2C-like domain-containing protein [Annulohypoxylon truncatum]|uniref:phosphatase 2C-like domain-containing protein n=1 Tax=Annulohypoxylon truncatum TaxID=327061 RepID=UPI00200723BB|nr:phosphatase 2C-like domain-containing protein [Annulohypoxylon truncatum]KAI1204230.1 phosphatase 2C-like domain-containing protein [Annulohypoxylon truncatum]
MLRSRVPQARLGRVATKPILQTPAKSLYSTNRAPSATILKKATKYTLVAGVLGAPGLWWLASKPTRANDELPVPRFESVPAKKLTFGQRLSQEDVTRILTRYAYNFLVKDVTGVDRYDGAQLASNSPCEDRFIHGQFPSPWDDGSQWMAWAIFDGHSGWQTAYLLEKQLLPIVRHKLGQVKAESKKESMWKVVQRAIKEAFKKTDDAMMNAATGISESKEPFQDKVKKMIPAYTGSSALLSLYDPVARILHVAGTGNSRAVMAQKAQDGRWVTMALSADHTGWNPKEAERINKQHPDEGDVVKDGLVLGIGVTRAFGDAPWKLPQELQKDLSKRFGAPLLLGYNLQTPPYLTAVPNVASFKIDPDIPSFLIMASDGFWKFVTDQQAVDLVSKWIESRGKPQGSPKPTYEPFDFSQFLGGKMKWEFVEERRTVQDENAAVHLVRNALGGNHHELLAGRLALTAPFSLSARDDITVQVVLFNQPGLSKETK